MTLLVPIVMFTWPLIVATLFFALPMQRAVVTAFIAAWLFLPIASFSIPGFTDYTKMTATCGGVLLGVLLVDADRLRRFRFSPADLPMLVWCLCPFASSISNGLGVYDGVSAVVYQTVTWGVPYFIGRACLSDRTGVRLLAVAFVIGGLIYVPLCLFEVRMSPQLHSLLYGKQPGHFATTMRYGGYRPTVFMNHGLMVAVWMCSATLVAGWLYVSGMWKRTMNLPAAVWLIVLAITAILCKSTGALSLFCIVGAVVAFSVLSNSRVVMLTLTAISPLWMIARSLGWQATQLVELASLLGSDRAGSLLARLRQEDQVISMALNRPWFGWGNWQSGLDQLWLITIRNIGLVGITALTLCVVLPCILLMYRTHPRQWLQPAFAPCAALTIVVLLYSLDHLFNGMVNPVFMLAAGAATGLLVSKEFAQAPQELRDPSYDSISHHRQSKLPLRRLSPGHA
jgi:hypothetical protein